jgi:hypothetical protein
MQMMEEPGVGPLKLLLTHEPSMRTMEYPYQLMQVGPEVKPRGVL